MLEEGCLCSLRWWEVWCVWPKPLKSGKWSGWKWSRWGRKAKSSKHGAGKLLVLTTEEINLSKEHGGSKGRERKSLTSSRWRQTRIPALTAHMKLAQIKPKVTIFESLNMWCWTRPLLCKLLSYTGSRWTPGGRWKLRSFQDLPFNEQSGTSSSATPLVLLVLLCLCCPGHRAVPQGLSLAAFSRCDLTAPSWQHARSSPSSLCC